MDSKRLLNDSASVSQADAAELGIGEDHGVGAARLRRDPCYHNQSLRGARATRRPPGMKRDRQSNSKRNEPNWRYAVETMESTPLMRQHMLIWDDG